MRKRLVFTILLLIAGASLSTTATAQKTRRKNNEIKRLAAQIAQAFVAGDFGRLDDLKLLRRGGSVQIILEETTNYEFEDTRLISRRFSSFRSAEEWLSGRRRRRGGEDSGILPREVYELTGCRKERCDFVSWSKFVSTPFQLQKIFYGYRNNRLFIKKLRFYY